MISVVIPLYNKAQSIVQTLDSVLAQTYTDLEVIVVNDGSTDGSGKVMENYIKLHPYSEIHLIHKENGGVSSARNAGILAAKGEYVTFLDGDDLWHPTYLAELNKLIEDYPNKGIYGIGCVQVYNDKLPKIDGDYYRGPHDEWSLTNAVWTGSSATASKNALIAVGLFDERMKYGEDKDMWYRLQLYAGGACYCKPLAYYRQDAENRAMKRMKPLNKYMVYYMDKFKDSRAENAEFRRFYDTEAVQTLYPYLFEKQYREDARRLSNQIDYSQLKWSMKFRMQWPWVYRMYEMIKSCKIV